MHIYLLMTKNTFSLVRKEEWTPKPRPEDKIRSPLAAQLLEQDIIKLQPIGSMQSSESQHMWQGTEESWQGEQGEERKVPRNFCPFLAIRWNFED